MQAKDIMTRDSVTTTSNATIAEVVQLLLQNKISGIPVIDQNNDIIGVVTEKDIIVAYDFMRKTDGVIDDFMSKEVIGVSEDTPVEDIGKMLVQKNIKLVPVLKDKKIVGIVSRRDVLKCLFKCD